MSKKERINKNTIPEGFTLGLAIYDAVPVVAFGVSVVLLGAALESLLFMLGGIVCFWAGAAKVAWKIIVVIKRKNIWWLFMQMRICMPIGFVIMIVAAVLCRNENNAGDALQFAVTFPVSLFFLVGIAGMVLMGFAAAKLDSADARTNWIEQTINSIAQLSVMMGVVFLFMSVGYYRADDTALSSLSSTEAVEVSQGEHRVVFAPKGNDSGAGLIIYPGGKVQYTAYAPLAREIAEKGITCVIVEMPLNYAFLDADRADDVMAAFPEIKSWYLAGHSLGGAFGSIYASKNEDKLQGLVLLAAYSTKPVEGIPVLSLLGSEDEVVNQKSYEKYRSNLHKLQEQIISGGNHAMFGSYGPQAGDGEGSIAPAEQWSITATAVSDFISSTSEK